jgi:hypothetical protein
MDSLYIPVPPEGAGLHKTHTQGVMESANHEKLKAISSFMVVLVAGIYRLPMPAQRESTGLRTPRPPLLSTWV